MFQTQAAIIHSGEATDKLIIMMLLSTVLFATMLVGKLFNWVYMTYCRSDNKKVRKSKRINKRVQQFSSTRSPCLDKFFCVSCEGLLGQ